MILLDLITGGTTGVLTGEAWAWWRTREQQPRHANDPHGHNAFDWLNREPEDISTLDRKDMAHRGTKPGAPGRDL